MGQIVSAILDKFHVGDWKDKQIDSIANKVFDRIKSQAGKDSLSFDDIHLGVLYIYNDINKYIPGAHKEPPSSDELKAFIQEYDLNLDGRLDREEFVNFVKKLTANIMTSINWNLLVTLIAAPTAALLTKKSTENVPGVGTTVQQLPSSVYASLVTAAAVLIVNAANQ